MNKKINRYYIGITFILSMCLFMGCDDDLSPSQKERTALNDFYFGADLSYTNQILDHNGVFKDNGAAASPYKIFADHGANVIRLRLFHSPEWTKTVYSPAGEQMYNDIKDVAKSIELAHSNNMQVLLDFHYSDTWADPDSQDVPEAWKSISSIDVLSDSVYQYTFNTITYLKNKGLTPEFVQVGNEINCGMLYGNDENENFPTASSCDNEWSNLGKVLNAAIEAVKAADEVATPKIALHVADPADMIAFTGDIINRAKVSDFDIIGFSYYPLWHTTIAPDDLSTTIAEAKSRFGRDLIMVETGYPWTDQWDDDYANQLGEDPLEGYPFTEEGQYNLLVKLTQEVKDGGGAGIIYWEPDWITSDMKDLWGTGSAWENATFFDFDGNTIKGISFMEASYK